MQCRCCNLPRKRSREKRQIFNLIFIFFVAKQLGCEIKKMVNPCKLLYSSTRINFLFAFFIYIQQSFLCSYLGKKEAFLILFKLFIFHDEVNIISEFRIVIFNYHEFFIDLVEALNGLPKWHFFSQFKKFFILKLVICICVLLYLIDLICCSSVCLALYISLLLEIQLVDKKKKNFIS